MPLEVREEVGNGHIPAVAAGKKGHEFDEVRPQASVTHEVDAEVGVDDARAPPALEVLLVPRGDDATEVVAMRPVAGGEPAPHQRSVRIVVGHEWALPKGVDVREDEVADRRNALLAEVAPEVRAARDMAGELVDVPEPGRQVVRGGQAPGKPRTAPVDGIPVLRMVGE